MSQTQRKTPNSNIGARIAQVRNERGISQAELRRRTGINVWRIEEGYYNPQIATLSRIATALDIGISKLLEN